MLRRLAGRITVVLSSALVLSTSVPASAGYGYCMPPDAPLAFLRKPTKPLCAADRSCDEFEVQMYRNEIDRYFQSLKKYLADVDTYRDDAYAYAKCMADLD
jgi:hypothetical protein